MNISQIYESLNKEDSLLETVPVLSCLTPWDFNSTKPKTPRSPKTLLRPQTTVSRKSDPEKEGMLRTIKCWNNKVKILVPLRESLKRTSFCFETNHPEIPKSKKLGIENMGQKGWEFVSSLKSIKRVKIKSHNDQEELRKHLSIGKLSLRGN